MQTITVVIILLKVNIYVAIKACTCMYMDETGHISTFLVTNLIVVLQWRNRVEKGKGKWVRVINHYMCIFGLLPV